MDHTNPDASQETLALQYVLLDVVVLFEKYIGSSVDTVLGEIVPANFGTTEKLVPLPPALYVIPRFAEL